MRKILPIILLAVLTACKSSNSVPPNPTGNPSGNPADSSGTADLRKLVEPFTTDWIKRSLTANPDRKIEIAGYMRKVQNLFCSMSDTANYDPAYLLAESNKLKEPKLAGNKLGNLKMLLVAIYQGSYDSTNPVQSKELLDLFCETITNGLRDNGV